MRGKIIPLKGEGQGQGKTIPLTREGQGQWKSIPLKGEGQGQTISLKGEGKTMLKKGGVKEKVPYLPSVTIFSSKLVFNLDEHSTLL